MKPEEIVVLAAVLAVTAAVTSDGRTMRADRTQLFNIRTDTWAKVQDDEDMQVWIVEIFAAVYLFFTRLYVVYVNDGAKSIASRTKTPFSLLRIELQ
jgi:hypothetical protein